MTALELGDRAVDGPGMELEEKCWGVRGKSLVGNLGGEGKGREGLEQGQPLHSPLGLNAAMGRGPGDVASVCVCVCALTGWAALP